MKCKHHASYITFGIEANGQTQKWEHTRVQAHRSTPTHTPALSSPVKMMILLYRTSDAEEMKSIINRTRNMQKENPRRPYDHTVQKENRQYGMTYM